MTQRGVFYDDVPVQARLVHNPGAQTAGASKAFDKFSAFTYAKVYAINVTTVTAGTSTYTAWNGTATVTASACDQISGIKVSGTTTTTYGPYAVNAGAAGFNRIQISQSGVGSATSDGGISMNPGDTFHVVRGTDATAVVVPAIEWSLDPVNAQLSN